MQRFAISFLLSAASLMVFCQNRIQRLQQAVNSLQADSQLKHGMLGFYVVNARTGEVILGNNAETGMAPASCQKVITSVAAFELLGSDYRYLTTLSYDGSIEGAVLKGNLHIEGTGDPTLGSWRWPATKEEVLLQQWVSGIRRAGIKTVQGIIFADDNKWGSATIPDGWIWQDIGNYYGAGASALNWRENQYDLVLKPGRRIGDTCAIITTKPELYQASLVSEITTAAPGTGDNAYIYLPPNASSGFVRGTIPMGTPAFTISGSFPNSALQLASSLSRALKESGVVAAGIASGGGNRKRNTGSVSLVPLYVHTSPPLDSINFWFLRKSINLYGETLLKTIGYEKGGDGSTDKGIELIRYFWSQRGIERSALHIIDGSGLSPQNRVTPAALVSVLQYARSRPWFPSFYQALPEINAIRMKSGTIGGAKSYTGYINSKDGNEYTFAIIINNHEGSTTAIQGKMWKLLDILK